jgi:hypothetical protein
LQLVKVAAMLEAPKSLMNNGNQSLKTQYGLCCMKLEILSVQLPLHLMELKIDFISSQTKLWTR